MVRLTFVCMEWWHSLAALYASTFLRPLNCPRNSIIDWIFKLNLWGAKWYSTGSTLKPNLNPNPKLWFCCEKQQNCKKKKKKQGVTAYHTWKFFLSSGISTLPHKTLSNLQTWHSANMWLQRWSHKDGSHFKNLLHFCCAISLASCYRVQWSVRKFNTAVTWAVVTTSNRCLQF